VVAFPATAQGAPVVVLSPDGHASARDDRFLTIPATAPPSASARALGAATVRSARGPTVSGELARLRNTHAISTGAYRRYSAILAAALRAERGLRGTRARELGAVLENLHAIAAGGLLSASRLPALFLTLDRNRQWWTTGPLLGSGQRVEFKGSEIVWEYYAGQGLELQVLGSFGKADGLYTGGRTLYPRFRHLLSELIPLAARRGGGLTWEYYFRWEGARPPWTSAMSQGTALEALTRAFKAFRDRSYLDLARRALPIFSVGPPVGVSVKTRLGRRYLLYSFAPGEAVINGFLQTLIGLYDFARASGNGQASRLFAGGDAEARAEVPRYDTGAWSLYEPGQEDDLSYHQLVTGFLHQLCSRTHARVYCTTAQHFDAYLKTPPALTLLTHGSRAGRPATIRFRLSKISRVGIVVLRGGHTVLATSASFPYGTHGFSTPLLAAGSYTVRLAATDLAGHFKRIVGTLSVS
jgi:hypothetical protein